MPSAISTVITHFSSSVQRRDFQRLYQGLLTWPEGKAWRGCNFDVQHIMKHNPAVGKPNLRAERAQTYHGVGSALAQPEKVQWEVAEARTGWRLRCRHLEGHFKENA